jgi:GntR family transcriptional regulator
VLTTTYLPHKLCPGLESADLTRRSLYEYLRSECGLTLARGRRTIEAVAADARQAKLLHIRRGAPLVSIESVSFLPDGRPIEFYFALHRGDRSRFEVELVRGRERGENGRMSGAEFGRLPPGGGSLRRTGRR